MEDTGLEPGVGGLPLFRTSKASEGGGGAADEVER